MNDPVLLGDVYPTRVITVGVALVEKEYGVVLGVLVGEGQDSREINLFLNANESRNLVPRVREANKILTTWDDPNTHESN